MMKHLFFLLTISISLVACGQKSERNDRHVEKTQKTDLDTLQTAYFASGCFWCVEAVYESVAGVVEAESGYSGGEEKNPTYKDVSWGRTGHAETVKVYYDSTQVSFSTLVDVFFNSHDPTTLNQQGPDSGTQYRSMAFYETDAEKKIIEDKISSLLKSKTFSVITTEVTEFEKFWIAEDYHQDYEKLNPNQPYVRSVSIPRLNAFKKKMPEVLKENLEE
jgi:peptide-methionine (S)-S-oxide reductase